MKLHRNSVRGMIQSFSMRYALMPCTTGVLLCWSLDCDVMMVDDFN